MGEENETQEEQVSEEKVRAMKRLLQDSKPEVMEAIKANADSLAVAIDNFTKLISFLSLTEDLLMGYTKVVFGMGYVAAKK